MAPNAPGRRVTALPHAPVPTRSSRDVPSAVWTQSHCSRQQLPQSRHLSLPQNEPIFHKAYMYTSLSECFLPIFTKRKKIQLRQNVASVRRFCSQETSLKLSMSSLPSHTCPGYSALPQQVSSSSEPTGTSPSQSPALLAAQPPPHSEGTAHGPSAPVPNSQNQYRIANLAISSHGLITIT